MSIINEPKHKNGLLQAIREQLEHRALWMYLLCDEARKKGLEPQEYAPAAIRRCGLYQGAHLVEKGGMGKSEMWYILRAEEDAEILYSMKEGVSADLFARLVEEGNTLEGVSRQRVRAGEVYYIPAGLLHALGGGITVAEIQENSDTTYRLYDYDRIDKNGQKRELHLADGLRVLRPYGADELSLARYERALESPTAQTIVDSAHFRVRLASENEAFCDEARLYFRAVLALSDLEIEWDGRCLPVRKYSSVFIPAGVGSYTVKGHALIADADCLFEVEKQ